MGRQAASSPSCPIAAVERAFNSRAHPANTARLEELAALRAEAAGLLGYGEEAAPSSLPSSAAGSLTALPSPLRASRGLLPSPRRVSRGLCARGAHGADPRRRRRLPRRPGARPGAARSRGHCRPPRTQAGMGVGETGTHALPAVPTAPPPYTRCCCSPPVQAEEGAASGPVSMADYRYYMEAELRDAYAVDHDALKAYFPLHTVLDGAAPLRIVPPCSCCGLCRCCLPPPQACFASMSDSWVSALSACPRWVSQQPCDGPYMLLTPVPIPEPRAGSSPVAL